MLTDQHDSNDRLARPCTAFAGTRKLLSGPLSAVAIAVNAEQKVLPEPAILVFDDSTGRVIDLDLRGSDAEILARLAQPALAAPGRYRARASATGGEGSEPRGRGRPKMGVVAREVTLLPRQWEWLSAQAGGASATLRRLVDKARREGEPGNTRKRSQEAAYQFMLAIAGNLAGYEEATRALFAGDQAALRIHVAQWPEDIRAHVLFLVEVDTTA